MTCNTPDREHELMSFELVFGQPMPTGICKPAIPGLNKHHGDLSEQLML